MYYIITKVTLSLNLKLLFMRLTIRFAVRWLAVLCLLAGKAGLAQTTGVKVSGILRNTENTEPIVGATVQLKGTTTMTASDAEGKFSITVPNANTATLVISYTGYGTKEVALKGQITLTLSLEKSSKDMDEVVIIGYGKQNRATVTSSISTVSTKELEHSQGANPLVQLQGKVAGLSLQISDGQPGASPQIFIRGGSSTSPEGDAPLLIVDGIVGQMRNMSDLNPDDIESVQVLKDAASTAIYGARAANGVIIVKTKGGQMGKAIISLKATHGLNQLGKQYNFTSARDYIAVSRKNIMNYNTTNPEFFLTGGRYGMSTGNPRNSRNTLEFLDTYIQNYGADYVAELIDHQGWQTMDDPATGKKLIFHETNYQDVTFQDAQKMEYDLNVSGGNDKIVYYVGLGALKQEGIVLGTDYKQYSALINTTYKLSNKLRLNTNINYQYRKANGAWNYQNVLSRSVTMPFTYRLNYEDGTPAPGEGVASFRNRNHEVYYKENYNDIDVYRTTVTAGLEWDIIPGLTFRPTAYYFTTEGIENYFEAYNEVNINRNASAAHNFDRQMQYDGVFNYDKSIGKNHHINAVLGGSFIEQYAYRMSGSGRGAPTDYITTLNATVDSTKRISTTQTTDKISSVFGRLSYDYRRKYLLAMSLRRDGSSRFATDNLYGLFPGVSAGWNIHSEPFWRGLSQYVQTFKLRSSWGQTGNNDLSVADTKGAYTPGNNYAGQPGILSTTLPNNSLVWETTSSFDIGLDIGLLNNRVNILLDYYHKLTSDRLFAKPLDATSGFSSIRSNYGSLLNEGFEIELSATPIRTKNINWEVNFNLAFNAGIVKQLPVNGEGKNRTGGNFVYNKNTKQYEKVGGFAEGERYGERWAYHFMGVYSTDEEAAAAPFDNEAGGRTKKGGDAIFEDVDGNGILDNRDMVFMGYIRPDKTGGFSTSFTYKQFSLRFVTDFAVGHVIDNSFRGRLLGSARNNNMTLTDVLGDDIWKEQGDHASIPKYTVQSDADYNYRNHLRMPNGLGSGSGYTTNNSLYYEKGDFLAFREVSLSYMVPLPAAFRKAYVKSLNIFAGVFNLGYLTSYKGLMPEIYTGNDQGSYARPRMFDLGVKVNFQ
jgi:TonB-linked SusC/RagA family outer membrane protein